MSRRSPPRPLEKVVQAECWDVLASAGCRVFRRNAGLILIPQEGGRKRAVKAGEPGAADLFGALPDGRHFELEIKRKDERPRLDQVRFLRSMVRYGPAFWVDDADDLRRILPHLLAGATVEYIPDRWTFRVEIKLPGGKKASAWTSEPGGDYDVVYTPGRR